MLKEHNHEIVPERKDKLIQINSAKEYAKKTNEIPRTIYNKVINEASLDSAIEQVRPDSLRQIVNRERNEFVGRGNFKTMVDIDIPNELRFSIESDQLFLWDDSGDDEQNIKIINDSEIQYIDGTFAISPLIFKQVLTINVIFNGKINI